MQQQASTSLSGNPVLQVQRISCKDVKSFNFFQKPSFYAVAALSTSTTDSTHQHQKQKTPADSVGGSNPEWKDTFRFDLSSIPPTDRGHVFLQFELFVETAVFSDRVSGRVFVPLDDLLAGGSPSDSFQTVMYQIQCPDGRPNGVLSFSYKASSSSPPQWPPVTQSPPTTLEYYPPTNIYPPVENYEPLNIYPPISPPNYVTPYPPPASTYYPPVNAVSGYPAPAPELAYLDRYDHGRFVPHDNGSLYPPVW